MKSFRDNLREQKVKKKGETEIKKSPEKKCESNRKVVGSKERVMVEKNWC